MTNERTLKMKTAQQTIYEGIIKQLTTVNNVGKVTFDSATHKIECKKFEYYVYIRISKKKITVFAREHTLNREKAYKYVYCDNLEGVDTKIIVKQLTMFIKELSILEYAWEHYDDKTLNKFENNEFSYIDVYGIKSLPKWENEPTILVPQPENEWHRKKRANKLKNITEIQYYELKNMYSIGYEAIVCNANGEQYYLEDELYKHIIKDNNCWKVNPSDNDNEYWQSADWTKAKYPIKMVTWADEQPTLIQDILNQCIIM